MPGHNSIANKNDYIRILQWKHANISGWFTRMVSRMVKTVEGLKRYKVPTAGTHSTLRTEP
jgi:hypothetical protein